MNKLVRIAAVATVALAASWLVSCKKENDNRPEREGIERSQLVFTEVVGESLEPHGDHFHGLGAAVEGESIIVSFDEQGVATRNGHLHLTADGIYKVELKAWDYAGREMQQSFVSTKSVADSYKVFLQGGGFILNANSDHERGAIFQPRELQYGDSQPVSGQYETTGILAYFTIGDDNKDLTKELTYVLRKINDGVKSTITRSDWNRPDYASEFPGTNILELRFEVHIGGQHNH